MIQMSRNILGLALTSLLVSCVSSSMEGQKLTITVENFLVGTRGAKTPDKKNQLVLKAYSYPSALRFYTDGEILRILRYTCDKRAAAIEVYKPEERSATIAWNFTQKGKGAGGTTAHGLARFGATLTEVESGVLTINCGERVY